MQHYGISPAASKTGENEELRIDQEPGLDDVSVPSPSRAIRVGGPQPPQPAGRSVQLPRMSSMVPKAWTTVQTASA